MSSYSKCRFCGNADYADFHEPRMCKRCSVSYFAGEEETEAHIIKLLEDNTQTMTSPLDGTVMRSLRLSPSDLIALIKGEK